MTTLDMMALIHELAEIVLDSNIFNVHHRERTVILRLRSRDGVKHELRFDVGSWVRVTRYEFKPPLVVTPWCNQARKLLKGARITALEQPAFDRYFRLRAEGRSASYNIYLELMAGGNIVVTDGEEKILSVLRPRKTKARELKPGARYVAPPIRFFDPRSMPVNKLLEVFKGSTGNLAQTLSRFLGLPGEAAEEACFRAGLDKRLPARDASPNEVLKLLSEVRGIIGESDAILNPNIVLRGKEPVSVLPTTYGIYINGYVSRSYESFNDALDDYAQLVEEYMRMSDQIERTNRERARLLRSIEEQEAYLRSYSEKAEILRKIAQYLMSNLWLLDDDLREASRIVGSKGWDALYNGSFKLINIVGYDPVRRMVTISVMGRQVGLDLSISAAKNVERIFDRAKELSRKARRAEVMIEELRRRLSSIRVPEMKVEVRSLKRPKPRWFESFHWFFSSDGYLVVGGRDASQNETLVRKRLEKNDVVFHADIQGSPFTLVKNVGRMVPEATVLEAAQLTVSYSRAWEMGLGSLDAYWVYPEQVSKKAPAGTYLSKGAFMIYGRRNYVRRVELELAIGVMVGRDGSIRVVGGPRKPLSKVCDALVPIKPGDLPRNEAARAIASRLREEAGIKIDVRHLVEGVMYRLPRGGVRLVS